MNKKLQALLASYARSVLGAGLALYMSGVTDPKDLLYALAAAIAPVVLRYANPNDTSFGRMPSIVEVEEALTTVKAPVKKTVPAKKTAAPKATTTATTKQPAKKTTKPKKAE